MGRFARGTMTTAALCLAASCGGHASNDGTRTDASAPDVARHDSGRSTEAGEKDAARKAGKGDAGGPKYGHNGPASWSVTSATVENGSDSFTENLYVPTSSGKHPVVSLSPALSQRAVAYTPYAERLASYGIVVLMRDDPGPLTTSQPIVSDLAYVIAEWLPAQESDASSPLHGKVDASKVGLTGHSRGGQVTLLAAEGPLLGQVVAWFGIDPVDSGSVDGLVESTESARTDLGSIAIPTTFLGAQVATACSPSDISYEDLYPAAPSPSVLITAVDASHTQFEVQSDCTLCNVCTPMGSADATTVLDYSVRYLTAFFARELLGDASVGATFKGAGAEADEAAGLVTIASH